MTEFQRAPKRGTMQKRGLSFPPPSRLLFRKEKFLIRTTWQRYYYVLAGATLFEFQKSEINFRVPPPLCSGSIPPPPSLPSDVIRQSREKARRKDLESPDYFIAEFSRGGGVSTKDMRALRLSLAKEPWAIEFVKKGGGLCLSPFSA
jgi:hypothetical protein